MYISLETTWNKKTGRVNAEYSLWACVLFFHSEKEPRKRERRFWHIKHLAKFLNWSNRETLLAVLIAIRDDTILGFDTKPAIYGLGKGTAIKALQQSQDLLKLMKLMELFNSFGKITRD